jgi:hypothetical protein
MHNLPFWLFIISSIVAGAYIGEKSIAKPINLLVLMPKNINQMHDDNIYVSVLFKPKANKLAIADW